MSEVMHMKEPQIVTMFLNRDENAISQADSVYGKRLLHLARNIVGNPQDAEECVSDTLLKAWNSIPPQNPRYLFAYLAKICRNDALGKLEHKNAQKRRAEVVRLTEEMECCIPDVRQLRSMESRVLGQALDSFVRTLPRENRLIFLRRYWYMDSVAEIARKLGLSEGAVHMRLGRIKEKLRTYLEKEGMYL